MVEASFAMELASELDKLPSVLEHLEEFARTNRLSEETRDKTRLAIEEILINVITHGGTPGRKHTIQVRLTLAENVLTLEVEDDGVSYNPLERKDPCLDLTIEQRPIGGLGVFLVKQLMDEMEYHRMRDKNLLILRKRRATG